MNVKQRQHVGEDVVGRKPPAARQRGDGMGEILLGVNNALGFTGRAGGIEQQRGIFGTRVGRRDDRDRRSGEDLVRRDDPARIDGNLPLTPTLSPNGRASIRRGPRYSPEERFFPPGSLPLRPG